MKLPSALLLFLLLGTSVFGQNEQYDPPNGPIKATMRVFRDKSTATMITDPDKHTSEEVVRDASGRMTRRTIYPLNDQNFARGAIHYNAKNVVVFKEVYVFDYAGRITESKLFSKDNQPMGKRVFVYEGENQARIDDYDKYGNLIPPPTGKGSSKRHFTGQQ